MTRSEAHQAKIDMINEWVRQFKEEGNVEAGELLILQFKPFLLKQCNKFCRYYEGVLDRDHALHEANTIFYNLLNEYTIGGPAYFNVLIERKLPLRLRYEYIKEIKRRQRFLSHSDEQFREKELVGTHDNTEDIADTITNSEVFGEIWCIIDDGETLTDREKDMLVRNKMYEESHSSIARSYEISRSRVSRIIDGAIEKVQYKVRYRR